MEWQALMIDSYGRVLEALEEALAGLTVEDLGHQPRPDCNSMGWLAWHLTRVQDDHIADLISEEQLWIKEGWHARFARHADPEDTGFGHGPAEMAAFKSPGAETLIAYHRAVLERSKKYIASLAPADLDRELDEPWWQPLPTVGVRLVSVMADNLEHCGQIAYVRGLLQGKGWLKY
ncbi:MAG: DUF664 domain-containing protein [Chloroflexi bacterium]|nr:DUF664 domain-containing protein [Chloroflexota bacterium]